jgi:hypothetical protein
VKKMGLTRLNCYISAKNLLTITSFGGLDPELGDGRNKPLYREFLFGVNISF